jgi:glycosyltransferase involved in cell wall biosynthesis
VRVLAAIVAPPHLTESGAVRAGTELSVALADAFCDVDVVLMADKDDETHQGRARIIRQRATNPLGFTRSFLPNRYRTLLYRAPVNRLLARGGYDLVHIHNLMPARQMLRIAKAARSAGVPYVVSTHGIVEAVGGPGVYSLNAIPQRIAWRLLVDRPLRWVFPHAARVLALSPADTQLLRRIEVSESMVSIVPNGLAENFVRDVPTNEVQSVLRHIGLDDLDARELPLCFFLANHANTKGIDVLLEAVDGVSSPIALVVGGQRRDHLDYRRWERSSTDDHRIIFPDSLSLTQIQALYQRADLFVLPTLADTFPLVILEAMAYGCPIISTDVGGIPYQVQGAEAVLVSAGDVQALRDGIEDLLADPDRRKRMSEASRRAGSRYIGWNEPARLAFEAYNLALGTSTG